MASAPTLGRGSPPPHISPSQIASAAKTAPSNPTITTPRPPTPSSAHIDALPSSPPQIYLNLLILESSLRLQYLSLRARLRLNVLLAGALALWVLAFTWLLFLRPREDGKGVGGSVYWMLESGEKLGWGGGVVTMLLFWGTGMYERGVRWPRRFTSTTNRGLRGFNLKVVVIKGSLAQEVLGWVGLLDPLEWWGENRRVNFQFVPRDLEGGKDPWHHARREHWIEEDVAQGGDAVKLLLLPKPFSPDFREGWEHYRLEYWERENGRRAELRRLVKARRREVARKEGGWLWWTGWRGWRKTLLIPGRRSSRPVAGASGVEVENTGALREKASVELVRERRRKEGLLRSESHSRGSSRSSTPAPEPDPTERVRRASTSMGTGRRAKKVGSLQATSRLSATEGLLEGRPTPQALTSRSSNVSTTSSSTGSEEGAGGVKKEETGGSAPHGGMKQEAEDALDRTDPTAA